MPARVLSGVALFALCVLLAGGCDKRPPAVRQSAKEFEKAEPQIREEVMKFFMPQLTRSKEFPGGDPLGLSVQVYFDEARAGQAGRVPFKATVFLGSPPPLPTNQDDYKARLRHDRVPGTAFLDAGKVVKLELGDEQSEFQFQIDTATGKASGREKFGGR